MGGETWAVHMRSALERTAAQSATVALLDEHYSLTRFRRGVVHQNLTREGVTASVRVMVEGQLGQIVATVSGPEAVAGLLDEACALARIGGRAVSERPLGATNGDDVTIDLAAPLPPAAVRRDAIEAMIGHARQRGTVASGAYVTYRTRTSVAVMGGPVRQTITASSYLRTVIESDHASGYAEQLSPDFRALDPTAVAREAADKALVSGPQRTLPPGDYDVVLDHVAVADWLRFLGVYGFNGQAATSGASFLRDVWGRPAVSPLVTLWDDATDPESLRLPFDFEGTTKRRTPLVTEGRIEAPVHDLATAAAAGTVSTGHANSPFGLQLLPGPAPFHWHMAPGTRSRQAIIASMRRGLLVTRMNYTDLSDRRGGVLTGPTRDGTLWIEDGEIRGPATDIRITDNLLGTLERVDAVGDTPRLVYDWWSPMHSYSMCYRVPVVKIAACHLSGASALD